MQVPFIDLGRTIRSLRGDVLKDWESCLDNTEFVGGPSVQKLEAELKDYLKVEHFLSCANGTDALVIALQAMGIGPGKRVALPDMTFWAPYEAVIQVGAEPVLIDIDAADHAMCFAEFEEAYARYKFDAAILVHLFGWASARLGEFRAFAKKHGIALLEDGAQAFGVEVDGEPIYHGAEVATISFYPAKVYGGASDGGGIMCRSAEMAARMRALCNHGRAGHYNYDYVGWNSRMGGLNAAYLRRMLGAMPEALRSRRAGEAYYQEFFAAHGDLITFHGAAPGITSNGYLSVATTQRKSADALQATLKAAGIGTGRTYPQTISEQPPAREALRVSGLERSRAFTREVINLPLFAGITPAECEASANALLKALRS